MVVSQVTVEWLSTETPVDARDSILDRAELVGGVRSERHRMNLLRRAEG